MTYVDEIKQIEIDNSMKPWIYFMSQRFEPFVNDDIITSKFQNIQKVFRENSKEILKDLSLARFFVCSGLELSIYKFDNEVFSLEKGLYFYNEGKYTPVLQPKIPIKAIPIIAYESLLYRKSQKEITKYYQQIRDQSKLVLAI